jgi:site-specific recombinase XerD
MIEQFFSNPATLSRLHAAPAGEHLDAFAEELWGQGYAKSTVRHKIRHVSQLCRWLKQQGFSVQCLDEERLRAFHYARGKRFHDRCCYWKTLTDFLKQLRASGVVPTPSVASKEDTLHPIERDFARYLEQERGLSAKTIECALPVVRRFLQGQYGESPLNLAKLTAKDVADFILTHIRDAKPASARAAATYLRSFFRFLHQRGDTARDLATAIPAPSNWRLSNVPKFLAPEEVEKLLQSCDRNSPAGQRDYAILLLLARLGLRGGEVAHMVLEDIDWGVGEIVVRGKSAREDRMPLPHDVGQALAGYLREGRPRCPSRRVFIRAYAPHQGFAGPVAICDIVRRALARAGLNPDFKGAHLLRHSLATHMLRKGSSLAEIGEVLRHQLPSTTEIYAKVDLDALRALAQPWKGAIT